MTDPSYAEQFIEEYFAECDEHLATIRRTLLALEGRRLGSQRPAPIGAAALQGLRRALHTIKGLSGMVGLACAERLAHGMEEALRHVDAADSSIAPELLEVLFSGTRHLEVCLAARRAGEQPADVEAVLAELHVAAGSPDISADSATPTPPRPPSSGAAPGAHAEVPVRGIPT